MAMIWVTEYWGISRTVGKGTIGASAVCSRVCCVTSVTPSEDGLVHPQASTSTRLLYRRNSGLRRRLPGLGGLPISHDVADDQEYVGTTTDPAIAVMRAVGIPVAVIPHQAPRRAPPVATRSPQALVFDGHSGCAQAQ